MSLNPKNPPLITASALREMGRRTQPPLLKTPEEA
jgi:hypothetical protein